MLRLAIQIFLSLLIAVTPTNHIRRRNLLLEDDEVNLDVIQNVGEPLEELTVPLMFHIPKAGGSSIKHMASHCLYLVTADQEGTLDGHDQDKEIAIVVHNNGPDNTRGPSFVNIDISSRAGLDRAKELDFAGSELAEVAFSGALLPTINALYDEKHKASVFSIFRHPIDREMSKFYYLQDAYWEKSYSPEWKDWTVLQYVESGKMHDNFIARSISGNRSGPITKSDMDYCKKFITEKVWVGLMTKFEESLVRFGDLFGWDQRPEWRGCMDDSTSHTSNSHQHPKVEFGSREYHILREKLKYDIHLYWHAEKTFDEQRRLFKNENTQ